MGTQVCLRDYRHALEESEPQSGSGDPQECLVVRATIGDILRLLNNSVAAMEAAPNEEAWEIVGRAVRSLQLTLEPLLIHPLLQRTVGVESLVDESVVWYLG